MLHIMAYSMINLLLGYKFFYLFKLIFMNSISRLTKNRIIYYYHHSTYKNNKYPNNKFQIKLKILNNLLV